ncbi:hypothetical protein [Pseudoalteromonas sp. EB27]|uniref:hypothetical protein n=1 Tax=Pseudoalteromonas sp. EB27 TaxID=1938368 RepID=UPI000975E21E|nr:hypothetical protein [Pseudoalteromonas sp. EB27]
MERLSFSIILYLLSVLSILYISNIEADQSLLFTFFFLSVFLILIHSYFKLTFFAIFQFSIIIILLPIYTGSYITTTELPFYPGGDAHRYYERVITIAAGDESLLWGRYKFFLYGVSSYYKMIFYFFGSKSPYHFMVLTAFFVSLTGPVVYLLIKEIIGKKIALKVYYFWVLNPLLLGLAVSTLRDPYVYFAVFYFIYVVIFFSNDKLIYKLGALSVLALYVINIRLDTACFLFVFFITFFLASSKLDFKKKMLLFSLILIPVLVFISNGLVSVLDFDNSMSLSYQMNAYTESRSMNTSTSSIVVKLQGTALGLLVLPLYTLVSPFPPPIFFVDKFNFADLVESLFSILFLMLLPRLVINLISYFKEFDRAFMLSLLTSIVCLLILLSLTSIGAFRQKLYIYPFIFSFIFYKNSLIVYKYYELIACFLFGFIVIAYIYTRF